jgi:hypothetical protein
MSSPAHIFVGLSVCCCAVLVPISLFAALPIIASDVDVIVVDDGSEISTAAPSTATIFFKVAKLIFHEFHISF